MKIKILVVIIAVVAALLLWKWWQASVESDVQPLQESEALSVPAGSGVDEAPQTAPVAGDSFEGEGAATDQSEFQGDVTRIVIDAPAGDSGVVGEMLSDKVIRDGEVISGSEPAAN